MEIVQFSGSRKTSAAIFVLDLLLIIQLYEYMQRAHYAPTRHTPTTHHAFVLRQLDA